jgi:SWI/SNF-related matrix-associated actin-dependent regulator 1 of chromatin subfamily A
MNGGGGGGSQANRQPTTIVPGASLGPSLTDYRNYFPPTKYAALTQQQQQQQKMYLQQQQMQMYQQLQQQQQQIQQQQQQQQQRNYGVSDSALMGGAAYSNSIPGNALPAGYRIPSPQMMYGSGATAPQANNIEELKRRQQAAIQQATAPQQAQQYFVPYNNVQYSNNAQYNTTTINNNNRYRQPCVYHVIMNVNDTKTFHLECREYWHHTMDEYLLSQPLTPSGGIKLLDARWQSLYGMTFKKHMKELVAKTGGDCMFDNKTSSWLISIKSYYKLAEVLENTRPKFPELMPHRIPRHAINRCVILLEEENNKTSVTKDSLIKRNVPRKIAETLAPFQREGVDFILRKEGRGFIADEMGLGKTIQSIACMSAYSDEWPVLVVTPSSARYHWQAEFVQWCGDTTHGNTTRKRASSESTEDSEDSWVARKASQRKKKKEREKGRRIIDDVEDFSDLDDGDTSVAGITVDATVDLTSDKPHENLLKLQDNDTHVMTSSKDKWLRHHKVVVVSFGLISSLCKQQIIKPGTFKCIIVDESHMLKNPRSQRSKLLVPVIKQANRRILLSGTPAFAKPNEMFSQINAIVNEKTEEPDSPFLTEKAFIARYGKGDGKVTAVAAKMKELHLSLGAFMIRRYKKDILKDLKPKARILARFRPVDGETMNGITKNMQTLRGGKGRMAEIASDQRTELERKGAMTWDEAMEKLEPVMRARRGELEQELDAEFGTKQVDILMEDGGGDFDLTGWLGEKRQALEDTLVNEKECHLIDIRGGSFQGVAVMPDKNSKDGASGGEGASDDEEAGRKRVLMKLFRDTGIVKIPTAIEHVKKMFEDPNCGKLCIFAHHAEVLDGIARGALKKIRYIRIDGKTLPKLRQQAVTQFQNDPLTKVALLSITAAGVAVTLTAASRILFAELFWTPAMLLQAEDRCHRIGQLDTVRAKYLIARNTLDDVLWKLADQKIRSLGEFVEGKKDAVFEVNGDKKDNGAFAWGDEDEKEAAATANGVDADDDDDDDEMGGSDVTAKNIERDLAALARDAIEKMRGADDDDDDDDDPGTRAPTPQEDRIYLGGSAPEPKSSKPRSASGEVVTIDVDVDEEEGGGGSGTQGTQDAPVELVDTDDEAEAEENIARPTWGNLVMQDTKLGLTTSRESDGTLVFKGRRRGMEGIDDTDYTGHAIVALNAQPITKFLHRSIDDFSNILKSLPKPIRIITVHYPGGKSVDRASLLWSVKFFEIQFKKKQQELQEQQQLQQQQFMQHQQFVQQQQQVMTSQADLMQRYQQVVPGQLQQHQGEFMQHRQLVAEAQVELPRQHNMQQPVIKPVPQHPRARKEPEVVDLLSDSDEDE